VRDLPIPGSGSGGGWSERAQRKGSRAMQRKYRLLRAGALATDAASIRLQRKSNSNQLTGRIWLPPRGAHSAGV
jgi:hypothetical protein